MSQEYKFVKNISIPSVMCYQHNGEKCLYCGNWRDATGPQDCLSTPNIIELNDNTSFQTAYDQLLHHDWIDNENRWSQTCDPSKDTNPASCTDNQSFVNTKNYIDNYRTPNPNAKNWDSGQNILPANDSFVETRFINKHILSSDPYTITFDIDDNSVNKGLNTSLNLFNNNCNDNQAFNEINTSISLKNEIGRYEGESGNDYRKYLRIGLPTHISYVSGKVCNNIEPTISNKEKIIEIDDSDLENGFELNTNGAIYSMYINDNDNKTVKYYSLNDDNYTTTSAFGSIVDIPININNFKIKPRTGSDYNVDYETITGMNDYIDDSTNKFNLSSTSLSMINKENIKLECPANFYLSGYSIKPNSEKTSYNVTPYCIRFVSKSGDNDKDKDKDKEESTGLALWIWLLIIIVPLIIVIVIVIIVVLSNNNSVEYVVE